MPQRARQSSIAHLPDAGRKGLVVEPLQDAPGILAKISRPKGNRSVVRPRLFARLDGAAACADSLDRRFARLRQARP